MVLCLMETQTTFYSQDKSQSYLVFPALDLIHSTTITTLFLDMLNVQTHVNFFMNPKSSYPDPSQCLFPESFVERNLDMMFQTEGLGIDSKENAITDYDSVKIKELENSIKFEDGHYNVKLPWHEDVLEKVPSNHNVALTVMDSFQKVRER